MPDSADGGSDANVSTQPSDARAGLLGKAEDVLGEAAKAATQLVRYYKKGGTTGITRVFGKLTISDSDGRFERLRPEHDFDEIHTRNSAGDQITDFLGSEKSRVIEEVSGITFIEYRDGRRETILPEGSFVETLACGSERIRTPSGYEVTQRSDGTRELKDPSDIVVTKHPNGDVEFQYPGSGRHVIYHPDGRVEAIGKKFTGETAKQAEERELDKIYKQLGRTRVPPEEK